MPLFKFIFVLIYFNPLTYSKTTIKMLKFYGNLTGKNPDIVKIPLKQCMDKCLKNGECLIAAWQSNGACSTYKLVVKHTESQQTLSIVHTPTVKKNVVAVKSPVSNNICPSLSNSIPGSITPYIQFTNLPVTYKWTKTSKGWNIKTCSACVLSRSSSVHLCVKLHSSEQLDVNYFGGFTQPDAVMLSARQQKVLLGVASQAEIDFVIKSRNAAIDSYWIGGKGTNCANGVCTKITWTDGFTTTSTFKNVPTTVANPCLAVVNGEVVGRDCNEKLRGSLCAWKLP